jgi:polysaccharide export outer membrane protein
VTFFDGFIFNRPVRVRGSRAARRGSRPRWAMLLVLVGTLAGLSPRLSGAVEEYLLGPGDVIRVNVFKNPDLSLDTRVSEAGTISFPLIGSVPVAGLTLPQAERKIADALKNGGFVLNPQVSILLTTAVGNQVAVLGQVNKPGRYPLEGAGGHLTGMLAEAGGISDTGSDNVIVTGVRNGQPFRRVINMVALSQGTNSADDIELHGGDTIFVNRAPMFYIYGQVQHPGGYKLVPGMTVMEALADGGGLTGKGTSHGIVLRRKDASGKVGESHVKLDTELKDQDVLYVKESLF